MVWNILFLSTRDCIRASFVALTTCRHISAIRVYAKDAMLADRIAIDYRKAGLTRRHVCMLEYAMLVSRDSESGAVAVTFQCDDVMHMVAVTLQCDCSMYMATETLGVMSSYP